MTGFRPDPGEPLMEVGPQKEQTGGKLKIFFGYAAGVGKTYAMLEAAHHAKSMGADVVAGYIEPHTRPETQALLEGLERLPPRRIPYKGIQLQEFDLDGALERRPQLLLVDELAHTNAAGCCHLKRYQDIEELLRAGINVYTTINVQHLESLHDIVAAISGVSIRERVPDKVFDSADQVELVDIEPADLLERLRAGKIYRPAQARRAEDHFFTQKNLAALREIEENCRAASLSDVARRHRVSLAYLSAQVKQATGSTFKELLQQKRLDKAQRLLRDTKLPVQAIAEAVGYQTTSYFYSIYKKQFGITPKECRSRLCNM